jgi:MFS family permease
VRISLPLLCDSILGFGNVADAVEILAIGYILTVYEESEGKLSSWESSTSLPSPPTLTWRMRLTCTAIGFLTAAVFAGMLGGGFLGGILGDIYGRKPVLLVNLAINAISAFLSAFSPSIYWLIFFRTLAGMGRMT